MSNLIARDPGAEKRAGAIAVAGSIARKHVQCYTRVPGNLGPAGVEDHFELQSGLWLFKNIASLLPLVFRIGQSIEDDWWDRQNFEGIEGDRRIRSDPAGQSWR